MVSQLYWSCTAPEVKGNNIIRNQSVVPCIEIPSVLRYCKYRLSLGIVNCLPRVVPHVHRTHFHLKD